MRSMAMMKPSNRTLFLAAALLLRPAGLFGKEK